SSESREKLMRGGDSRAGAGEASAGGGALLLLGQPLAVDAVARRGHRVQPLVADRLAAALAVAGGAVVDLLQRIDDVAQLAAVAVAELEEELARVGGVGLIPEVLDGVVVLVLAVQRGATHTRGELGALLEQRLPEARQSLLLHHDLQV